MQKKQQAKAELKRFGKNMSRERTNRGIIQQALAEAADLNVRTAQKIEAGQTNILITTATRIRKALGCRWEKLLG